MPKMNFDASIELRRHKFHFFAAETRPEVVPDKPGTRPDIDEPGTGPGGVPADPGGPPDPGGPGRRFPPNCPTIEPGGPGCPGSFSVNIEKTTQK